MVLSIILREMLAAMSTHHQAHITKCCTVPAVRVSFCRVFVGFW